ncbi:DUF6064 family protein [Bradyrhizobium sp. UFLA05-153]
MLPFTSEQFLADFVTYNSAIWPIQILAYLLGGVAVAFVFRPPRGGGRIISGILAAMWLWTGLAYHGVWFSAINRTASLFAALFVAQGCYFLYAGVYGDRIRYGRRSGLAAWVSATFIFYAAILYPLIGVATGHHYPEMPMFGVTPCPVTIFTFGLLLLTVRPVPRSLLVPFAWSLMGGSAAILLNISQDWLLLVSGCIAAPLIAFRNHKPVQDIQAA